MSQKKVEMQKASKLKNKNYTQTHKKKKILTTLAVIAACLVLGFLIYLGVKPEAPDYSQVNTGTSRFDDAAIAQLAGSSFDFSQFSTEQN